MRLIKSIAVLALVALGLTASTASARPMEDPMGMSCALPQMSRKEASRHVLVVLEVSTPAGTPRDDFALKVNLWKGPRRHWVGYAHPGCWTAIRVSPGTPGHRPNLCVEVRLPHVSGPSGPCARPKTYPTKNFRWVTYTFQVTA